MRCDACNKVIANGAAAASGEGPPASGPSTVVCPQCGFENKLEPQSRKYLIPAILSAAAAAWCFIFTVTSALAVEKLHASPPPDLGDLDRRAHVFTVQAVAWGVTTLVVLGVALHFYLRHRRERGAR